MPDVKAKAAFPDSRDAIVSSNADLVGFASRV
jgi:hypothetical protein